MGIKSSFKVRSKLDEKGVKKALEQASVDPIRAAAFLVEAEAKRSLSVGGQRKVEGGRNSKGQFQKNKTRGVPSVPPNPPHAQTGNLRGSIKSAGTKEGTWIVGPGTKAFYGRIHEFGGIIPNAFGKGITAHMPPRPYMRPALAKIVTTYPALWKMVRLAGTEAGKKLNAKKGKKP